jgi:hypothetical protein
VHHHHQGSELSINRNFDQVSAIITGHIGNNDHERVHVHKTTLPRR